MTNLDIIKHLVLNNPTRLAEFLDDIYCVGWNCGVYVANKEKILEKFEIDDFNVWLSQDASKSGYFCKYELEKWSKLIEKENNNAKRI